MRPQEFICVSGTVRDRRQFLRQRVLSLAKEIEASEDLKADVRSLVSGLEAGAELPGTPSDAEWDLLLTDERQAALAAYFLRLRAELAIIEGEGQEARKAGRLTAFLDGPVPKLAGLSMVALKVGEFLVVHGHVVMHALGIGYSERVGDLTGEDELL
jgi:hypothetical protein